MSVRLTTKGSGTNIRAVVPCPSCHRRHLVGPPRHHLVWSAADGLTVTPNVLCPCGTIFRIRRASTSDRVQFLRRLSFPQDLDAESLAPYAPPTAAPAIEVHAGANVGSLEDSGETSMGGEASTVAQGDMDEPVQDEGDVSATPPTSDPVDYPCPYCGAEAGSPCLTSSGNETDPHAARVEAADLTESA